MVLIFYLTADLFQTPFQILLLSLTIRWKMPELWVAVEQCAKQDSSMAGPLWSVRQWGLPWLIYWVQESGHPDAGASGVQPQSNGTTFLLVAWDEGHIFVWFLAPDQDGSGVKIIDWNLGQTPGTGDQGTSHRGLGKVVTQLSCVLTDLALSRLKPSLTFFHSNHLSDLWGLKTRWKIVIIHFKMHFL